MRLKDLSLVIAITTLLGGCGQRTDAAPTGSPSSTTPSPDAARSTATDAGESISARELERELDLLERELDKQPGKTEPRSNPPR